MAGTKYDRHGGTHARKREREAQRLERKLAETKRKRDQPK
jgi:hypothetical protein